MLVHFCAILHFPLSIYFLLGSGQALIHDGGTSKLGKKMNRYPQPEPTHSKGELKTRAQDRATQAKAMRGKGMSLRVIAADLGLSKSMVRNYVQGVAIPPGATLIPRPRKQPKQYDKKFSTCLSVAIYEALRDSAKDSGRTIGAQGRQMIELGLWHIGVKS